MDQLTVDGSEATPEGIVLNADEQDSLAVGSQMVEEQEQLLAGKYKSPDDLEKAYLELQQKLGSNEDNEETFEEETFEEDSEEQTEGSVLDQLWDEYQTDDGVSDDLAQQINNLDPSDIAREYLEYRSNEVQRPDNRSQELDDSTVNSLYETVGGEESYNALLQWASDNFQPAEIEMYDSVVKSGDPNSIFFAMYALNQRYQNETGVDGELLTGKAASTVKQGFSSQQEMIAAMNDPRYDRDPGYRDQVMAKLSQSNINF
jgi:hypothetical protein